MIHRYIKAGIFFGVVTGLLIGHRDNIGLMILGMCAGSLLIGGVQELTEKVRINRTFDRELSRRADIVRGSMIRHNQADLLQDFEYGTRVLRGAPLR